MSTTLEARPATTPTESLPAVYDRIFWLAYAANIALVTANALTFRFAELVAYLGGTEHVAGTIVSVGVFGAIAMRVFLGQGIDTFGTRKLWLASTVVFVASCSLFLLCGTMSPLIYVARLGFAVALSGMFTCSIVHIQNLVPAERRTEIIGNLGSSGFVGMIIGSQLGDFIFKAMPEGREKFLVLFGLTTALGIVYFCIVAYLTKGDNHQRPAFSQPAHKLIFRYWPGNVVLVALMMGISFTVTTVFLTRYATHMQFANAVGTFFTGYALSAFIFRIATRNWSRTVGRHKMILFGLLGHAVGHAAFPFMTAEWQFIFPAIAGGFGHALLFPAVVSKGAGVFPKRYRGSGTTLVLGFVDLGMALFAPLLGAIIDYYDHVGFSQMFFTSAGTSLVIAVIYAATTARKPDIDRRDDDDDSLLKPPSVKVEDDSDPNVASVRIPFPGVGRHG